MVEFSKEKFRRELEYGREREALSAAMEYLAECCREVLRPTRDGPPLHAVLTLGEFENILQKQGLAIIPETPAKMMQLAFRRFKVRYQAMLAVLKGQVSAGEDADKGRSGADYEADELRMTEKSNKPDVEFVAVVHAHSDAGKKWIRENIAPNDEAWDGVIVKPWHASYLGDKAVADGLWISGLVPDIATYEER